MVRASDERFTPRRVKARLWLRAFGLRLIGRFGAQVFDQETCRPLGRALIVPWRGKIYVIGLEAAVRPTFLPQTRLTYWKQELGFTVHPPPDFPNMGKTEATVKSEELSKAISPHRDE